MFTLYRAGFPVMCFYTKIEGYHYAFKVYGSLNQCHVLEG